MLNKFIIRFKLTIFKLNKIITMHFNQAEN